jgi:hypothetical protein
VLALSKSDNAGHISCVCTASNQGRISVNHAIPDATGLVVVVVAWENELALKMSFEVFKSLLVDTYVKHLFLPPEQCFCILFRSYGGSVGYTELQKSFKKRFMKTRCADEEEE